MRDKNKYLLIYVKDNSLIFCLSDKEVTPSKFLNSNKIYHNVFAYSLKYFKSENRKIMDMINIFSLRNKIYRVFVEDVKLVELVLKFIRILRLNQIYIKNFKALSISECNLIINNRNLAYVNAYYIPTQYLNKMKSSGKKVDINYRDSISDEFMLNQDAIDSDALYYKKTIHLNNKYTYKEKDIVEFLKLNRCLETIHIHNFNKELLESIVTALQNDNRKEISILLYQDDSGSIAKNFEYLKKTNTDYSKKSDGEIKVVYTEKFVKNNLFRQLSYNNLKLVIVMAIYVLFVGVVFSELYMYMAKLEEDRLSLEMLNNAANNQTNSEEEVPVINKENNKYDLAHDFDFLISKNKDTVGWLKVNNTNVNYPVVQGNDNDYYLKHDFYKKWTSVGWIFMDFRNNPKELNSNTIIYGHRLNNGMMFSSLQNTLNASWYKKPENQIIEFDLPGKKMKWQIISMYKTEYTTDYLVVDFENTDFIEWVNKIKKRSIYDFKVDVNPDDKILTLSTCSGLSSANRRMAIHAKLIEEVN